MALPEQTFSSGGVSIRVVGHLASAQVRDGTWIIQVPYGRSAQVTYVSHGAMLNCRGTNTVDVHTATVSLPLVVDPTDALVVAKPGSGRGNYWSVPGRSSCTEASAFVFVPYAPSAGMLRPPAIGDNWIVRFLRSQPIYESLVSTARFPSVVDVDSLPVNWQAWGQGKPEIPYLTGLLRPFSGEFYDGWSTDTRTPDQQHPGYGSYYAGSAVSPALVQLCSTAPAAAKMPLALAIVQRGLDLIGAFADGRRNPPENGHAQGRKALIVAAGHLLGVPEFTNPTAILGPVFQEDMSYRNQSWWFGGWDAGWSSSISSPTRDGTLLAQNPATWGSPSDSTHASFAWAVTGYMSQTVGSQIGTALAMRLFGRTQEMGVNLDKMVTQWMQGPPAAAKAELMAANIPLPWGEDYSVGLGVGFCAAAWRKYA